MDIFLQTGIGLLAAVAGVWVLIVKRRVLQVKAILGAIMLTTTCGGMVAYGGIRQAEADPTTDAMLSAKQMMTFCNALVENEDYEEALELVEVYSAEYGYDNECSLVVARVSALMGKYDEASGIYDRLLTQDRYKDKVEAEAALLNKIAAADTSYVAIMDFLEENGMNPEEYGYTKEYVEEMEAVLDITHDDVKDLVTDMLYEQYDTDAYEDYLELVADVDELYALYKDRKNWELSEEDKEILEDLLDDMEELKEENPAMYNYQMVSEADLKLTLLEKDYESFVENIDENSGYEELLIASELYINGVVKERDFAEEYTGDYQQYTEIVADHLDDISNKLEDELGHLEVDKLEAIIDSLESAQDDPVLYVIKSQLEGQITEDNTERSKISLGISKIEYFYDNEPLTTQYFAEAIKTGAESEDVEYSQSMEKLNAIISSNGSENITLVDEYVMQAIENSLPADCYTMLPVQTQVQEGEGTKTFAQMVNDYISEVKSTISIGQIDVSEFETVKAEVVISSKYAENSEELREILTVYDCGVEITDFEIEKIEYDTIHTILVCDVSGSMSGSMNDLISAVNNYVECKNNKESVSIVTFSDGIVSSVGFTEDKDVLLQFSQGMSIFGGTNIYGALHSTLSGFETTIGSNDVIILMTDGQDGSRRSDDTIYSEIGTMADDKGVTIYTVGLGDVDESYLSVIADSGNGEFVYVSDSESLVSFYGMLQSQVDNQYLITYKAKDTLLASNRGLEVRIREEDIFDYKEYSLYTQEQEGLGSFTPEGYVDEAPLISTLAIEGLNVRSAFKSDADIVVSLIGTGFTEDASTSMKLIGDIDYDVKMEYVDANTYKVTIPSSVSVGKYDLQIVVNDKTAYIPNGFTLWAAGDTKSLKFGPYTFTSIGQDYVDGAWILSGNVQMNGWLNFNGDVTIRGDIDEGTQISVTDESGSYVRFDADTAVGLGAYFAEKGIAFNIPALGTFDLYNDMNDSYNYSGYHVDSIRTTTLKIFNLVHFDAPVIKLYPDNIKLEYKKGSTVLPFQDVVFSAAGIDNPFSFEVENSAIVSDKNLGIVFEFSGEDDRDNYRAFNMFNAPIYLDMNELKISVNTIEHKYSFGGMVQIAFLDFGLGADISLNGFNLDSVLLTIDADKTLMIGQVPVTFSKARIGAENIETAIKNKSFGNLTFVGQLDIAVAKVSEFFPKVKKYVGDMSIASLEDATFKFRWKPFTISTSSTLKIFDEFTLAKSEFEMGNFAYTNELLGLKNRDVVGFRSAIKKGFMWDISNCHIDISGTGELTGTNRFMGIQYEGVAELDIRWWLLHSSYEKSGTVLVGVYYTESGAPQFTVAVAYESWTGKNKKLYYYIDENGKTGDKNGKL